MAHRGFREGLEVAFDGVDGRRGVFPGWEWPGGGGREMRNGLAKGRGGSGRWRCVSVGTWDLLSSSRGVFTQTFIFQVTSHLVRWQDVPPPT